MPIPSLAGIGAISGAQSGALSAITGMANNAVQMAYNERQYKRQRRDNIDFWNMQNAYNTPQAQMQRYEAAGLNKNLVVGQGNAGNASPISSVDQQRSEIRAPQFGNAMDSSGLNFVNQVYDLDIKQAQTDNLKAQNTVILQDAMLKKAQIESVLAGTRRSVFNLDFEQGLASTSAEARREQLRQLKTAVDLSVNKDAREAALTSSHLLEGLERMRSSRTGRIHTNTDTARIRKQIELMDKEGKLKDWQIDLSKKGIGPNDPWWSRIAAMKIEDLYNAIPPGNDGGSFNFLKWMQQNR